MLLSGSRLVTYGAVMVALGVILALVSSYTPVGPRVLFVLSGIPVLMAESVSGKKGAACVYLATAMILCFLVNPLRGTAYLLVTGGVPLVISLLPGRVVIQALSTGLLGLSYLFISVRLLTGATDYYQRLLTLVPMKGSMLILLAATFGIIISFAYPIGLGLVKNRLQAHWLYQEIFKP